eukprot:10528243-Lingulodinium_polyedra.AAC.1
MGSLSGRSMLLVGSTGLRVHACSRCPFSGAQRLQARDSARSVLLLVYIRCSAQLAQLAG